MAALPAITAAMLAAYSWIMGKVELIFSLINGAINLFRSSIDLALAPVNFMRREVLGTANPIVPVFVLFIVLLIRFAMNTILKGFVELIF